MEWILALVVIVTVLVARRKLKEQREQSAAQLAERDAQHQAEQEQLQKKHKREIEQRNARINELVERHLRPTALDVSRSISNMLHEHSVKFNQEFGLNPKNAGFLSVHSETMDPNHDPEKGIWLLTISLRQRNEKGESEDLATYTISVRGSELDIDAWFQMTDRWPALYHTSSLQRLLKNTEIMFKYMEERRAITA